jgi:hypothetical protein
MDSSGGFKLTSLSVTRLACVSMWVLVVHMVVVFMLVEYAYDAI